MARPHRLTVSDIDIYRSANTWIARHGDRAPTEARSMVDQMRRAGDRDGADVLLRIVQAIEALQASPKSALN